MGLTIRQSVGINGVNQQDDVKIIQVLLNTYTAWKSPFVRLKIDGDAGKNTKDAIKQFQREAAGSKNPDGRVDPGGKTFRYLTMYLKPVHTAVIQKQATVGQMLPGAPVVSKKTISTSAGLKEQAVVYSGLAADKQIVSEYSIRVIKMALKESGVSVAVITSTIRTPEEQAKIMLKNAKKGLDKQYELYDKKGDTVLKVYEQNKSKSDADIIKLMVEKIEEWAKEGKYISKHCMSKNDYSKSNIIDIGLNSMKSRNPGFDSKKFTAALEKLKAEGYLEVCIDETMKSNSCWHIEIKVNKKALEKYDEGTILSTVSYVNPK